MDSILSLVKSYFILAVLLMVLSYLAPKEEYKRYFQYFIGIWLCVLLLRPVIALFTDGEELAYYNMKELEEQLGDLDEWQEEGVDIFEIFRMDSEAQ